MEAQWSNIFDNTFLNAMVNAAIERNIKIKELTERVREAEKNIIVNNFPSSFMKFDFNRIQDVQTENRLTINKFKIGLKYKVDIDL